MGRTFRPTYTANEDGQRVKKTSPSWAYEHTDSNGRTRRKGGFPSEKMALDALHVAEHTAMQERHGLPVQRVGELRLDDLLRDYLASLSRRVTPKQALMVEARIRHVMKHGHVACLKDLRPEKVETVLNDLQERGKTARTVNRYLGSLRAMMAWGVKNRRLPFDPLPSVSKLREHVTRPRRPLTEAEVKALLESALTGPARRALRMRMNKPKADGSYKAVSLAARVQAVKDREGRQIRLIYRILVRTGLRVNELRLLRWSDLDLNAGEMVIRSEVSKNRKASRLPIAPHLIEELNAWRAESHTGKDGHVVVVSDRILKMFNDDCLAAGIAKVDAAGRHVDLHCLRHTFGHLLVGMGVDIKTVQTLMRHSTPSMTLGVYAHSDKGRLRDAVAALSALDEPVQDDERAIRTGTDDLPELEAKAEAEPPSNRQAKVACATAHSHRILKINILQEQERVQDVLSSEPRVGGSTPSGRTSKNPAKNAGKPIFAGPNENPEPVRSRKPSCRKLNEMTRLASFPAKEPPSKNNSGEDREGLELIRARWDSLPAEIKMAIMALVRSMNP
jgi:integrase